MFGFKSILVPLDGSSYSEQALPMARRLAQESQAALHIAMVHEPAPIWFEPGSGVGFKEFDDQARHKELLYLERIASRFAAGTGLAADATLLDGNIVDAIRTLVESQAIDLVVMTTHARNGLSRLWLGSVANGVVRSLNTPVLVIHPTADGSIHSAALRRILVPLDGSEVAASILDHAKAMARLTGAELLFAMVVEPMKTLLWPLDNPMDIPLAADENRALHGRDYLEAIRSQCEAEGIRATTRLIVGRGVSHQIQKLALAEQCDMIVLATHGRGGFNRLLWGSVADRVVRDAAVPVMILRPAGAMAQETDESTTGDSRFHAGSPVF